MANTKKNAAAEMVDNTVEKPVDIKTENGRMSLFDLSKIVNTVVDSVFTERNGRIEFTAELYEVLLAYLEIGAFYPRTRVLESGLDLFFIDYIDGKYYRELGELKANRLAQYIENAVEKKVAAKMRQIENPLINSMVKLVDVATVLAQKYVDDIDNIGTSDIKGFIEDFAKLAKNTNPQTVTDAVIKLHKNDAENGAAKPVEKAKAAPRKQSGKAKRAAE